VDPAVPVAPAKDTSVDPRVLDFIVGPSRKRGRPTKALQSDLSQTNDDKRLLDVREAAQRLGLSKSTLDKMRCSGRGPRFIRATDRAVRYDPADLAAFANDRRRRSTSEDAIAALCD
jgi:predicted DNA-binding transcriptional regulator AlpA